MNSNETLTNDATAWLDDAQRRLTIHGDMPIQRTESELEAHILATAKLSRATRVAIEHRLVEKAKKRRSLRERKRYTRKPGHVHPKKKEATARRRYRYRWEEEPFSCLIHGYGAYNVDKALWDKHIAPLWAYYLPSQLSLKKYSRDYDGAKWGTKAKPYTIYSFDIVHATLGVVYNGRNQQVYDLSCSPEALTS